MDKETKAFIESQNKALLEGVSEVIHDVILMVESRMDKLDAKIDEVDARLSSKIDARADSLQAELQSVKRTVERIDERTQNQVEALYEELRVTQRGVKVLQLDMVRVKTHIGIPA